jgi:hypothetical protein
MMESFNAHLELHVHVLANLNIPFLLLKKPKMQLYRGAANASFLVFAGQGVQF